MKELNERLDKQTEERDRKIHSQQKDLKNKEFELTEKNIILEITYQRKHRH